MPKLITPISYSDKLSVCERIGQPVISDDVRQVVNLPLADLQPVDGRPPAVGKFLQANQQAAMLKHFAEQGFTAFEIVGPITKTSSGRWLVTFSQRVGKVLVGVTYSIVGCTIYWASSVGAILKYLSYVHWTRCDFVGTKFYYSMSSYIGGSTTFTFYGFYR